MKKIFGWIFILIGIGNLFGFIDRIINPNFAGVRYGDSIIWAIILITLGIWMIRSKKRS